MKKRELRPKEVRVWYSIEEHRRLMTECQGSAAPGLGEYIHGLSLRHTALRRCDTAQMKHRQNELLAAILQSLESIREGLREKAWPSVLIWLDCLFLEWFSKMSELCTAGETAKGSTEEDKSAKV